MLITVWRRRLELGNAAGILKLFLSWLVSCAAGMHLGVGVGGGKSGMEWRALKGPDDIAGGLLGKGSRVNHQVARYVSHPLETASSLMCISTLKTLK
jgi:hypothetical protein